MHGPCVPTALPPVVDRTLYVELANEAGLLLSVGAAPGFAVTLAAASSEATRFVLVDLDYGDLRPGDEVLLLGAGERYLGVDFADPGLPVKGDRTVGYQMNDNCKSVFRLQAFGDPPRRFEDGARLRLRAVEQGCLTAGNRGREPMVIAQDGAPVRAEVPASLDSGTLFTLRIVREVVHAPIRNLSGPLANPNLFSVGNFMDLERHKAPDGQPPALAAWSGGNTYEGHTGTDLGSPRPGFRVMDGGGFAVLAVADGEVIYVAEDRDDRCHGDSRTGKSVCPRGETPIKGENEVLIRHDGDFVSVYAHLMQDSVPVSVGDRVRCGQLIGRVGSSGGSSGPHLHFELKRPHDPAFFTRHPGGVVFDDPPTWNFWRRSQELDPYALRAWADLGSFNEASQAVPRVTCSTPDNLALAAQGEAALVAAVAQRGARFDACQRQSDCGAGLFCLEAAGFCDNKSKAGEACTSGYQCPAGHGCQDGTCRLGPNCTSQCPSECKVIAGIGCVTSDRPPRPCGLKCL